MDRLSLQSPLRLLSVFVFYLLQAHSCRGQSQLIGPPQPIVARVGDDIILPCHLKPAVDVVVMTLEWKRPGLASEFVLVWRDGQDFERIKNPSYKERSSLFIDELKRGNISLQLSKVQLSDQGTYECYIPKLIKKSSVKLVVGESELIGSSQKIVATVGDDIILPCHLEPAVDVSARTLMWTKLDLNHRSVHVWHDGQDLIHVKDPSYRGRTSLFTDGLKHGNISLKLSKVKPSDEGRYKCGIPDMNTHSFIELVVDDFFIVQSSSVPVITGLAVSLAVWIIMFILLLLFVVWKWRLNRIKTKRSHSDQTKKGEKKNNYEINKSVDQSDTEEREREREQLMTHETVEMEVLKGNGQKKSKPFKKKRSEQQLQEEKRREEKRREEAEKEVEILKEELQIKKIEIETKGAELQQLHEEKKRNEDELQSLKEELEKKKKRELERTINNPISSTFHSLMKDKQAAEAQMKKTNEELKNKDEEISQLKREFEKQLCDDLQQKKEEAERELEELMIKNTEIEKKPQEETTKREEAEKEEENPEKEIETKANLESSQQEDEPMSASDEP